MKFIATDLDGTFLNDEKTFNQAHFAQILDQWLAQGNHFVIATGRELRWIESKFDGFMDRLDIVASNGAVVKPLNQVAQKTTIALATLRELQALLENMERPQGGLRTYTDQAMYLVEGMGTLATATYDFMNNLYDHIYEIDSLAAVPEPVTSVTGRWDANHAAGKQVMEAINASNLPLFATTSGYGTVDILPQGVNKAVALAQLLKTEISTDQKEVIAFGDGMNDYEMLRYAQIAYVMPNGNQFLLNQSDFKHVVADNNHEGVLKTVKTLLEHTGN